MSNPLSFIDDTYRKGIRRFGSYVCDGLSTYASVPKSLEEEVFLESFGNTKSDLEHAYEPYETRSFFLFVYDHKEQVPAAMARIVVPDRMRNDGTKTTDDLRALWHRPLSSLTCNGVALSGQPYWDVATLAVNKFYRGILKAGLVSIAIYNSIMTSAMYCGVDMIIAVLDEAAYRTGNWQYKSPFSPIDGLGSLPYMGSSSSIPVYCRFSSVRKTLEQSDPNTAEVLFTNNNIGELLEHVDLTEVDRVYRTINERQSHVLDLENRSIDIETDLPKL